MRAGGFKYQHHRASPHLLSECIQKLKPHQVEEVKRLGFEKMLSFAVNGIPGKLAYFVLEKFNDKLMFIDVGERKLEVSSDVVHQLLGIPNEGIDLESLPKVSTNLGEKWKARYPNPKEISRDKIVNMIQTCEDGDFFPFDFIMLFVSSIIWSRTNGHCKTDLPDKISEDLELKDVNWCKFVVDTLRGCKKKWKRNPNYQFAGALTILTLIYVDSISCNGINEIRSIDPISFWTMKNLQQREDLEITAGEFGLGEYRGLFQYKDISNQQVPAEEEATVTLQVKISNKMEAFIKMKKQLEKDLKDALESNKEDEGVVRLANQYKKILEVKPEWMEEKNAYSGDDESVIAFDEVEKEDIVITSAAADTQEEEASVPVETEAKEAYSVADEVEKEDDQTSTATLAEEFQVNNNTHIESTSNKVVVDNNPKNQDLVVEIEAKEAEEFQVNNNTHTESTSNEVVVDNIPKNQDLVVEIEAKENKQKERARKILFMCRQRNQIMQERR